MEKQIQSHRLALPMTRPFHHSIRFLFLLLRLSLQQSAELEDLQRLCPDLKGTFCSHCDHKSVEQICPIECNFCSTFRSGGMPRLFGNSAPQNLIELKRQCATIRFAFCYVLNESLFSVTSINELCVEECLDCETGQNDEQREMLTLLRTRQQSAGDGLAIGDDGTPSVGEAGEQIEFEGGGREGPTEDTFQWDNRQLPNALL